MLKHAPHLFFPSSSASLFLAKFQTHFYITKKGERKEDSVMKLGEEKEEEIISISCQVAKKSVYICVQANLEKLLRLFTQ